jgi:hypothetical protein
VVVQTGWNEVLDGGVVVRGSSAVKIEFNEGEGRVNGPHYSLGRN